MGPFFLAGSSAWLKAVPFKTNLCDGFPELRHYLLSMGT